MNAAPIAAHGHDPSDTVEGGRVATSPIDFTIILSALIRWRWLMIGAVLLCLIAATIYSFLSTPLYRAAATLEIRQQRVQLLRDSELDQGASYDPNFMETQFALLRSGSLAQRVARDIRLAANPALGAPQGLTPAAREGLAIRYITEGINISQVGGSRLILVQFTGDNPQIAADIANSYVRNFIRSDADRRVATTASARQLLSDRVNSAKAALETSERALVAYAEREGIVQVNPVNTGQGAESSADGSLDANSLVATNAALAAATNERITAQQRYEQARRSGVLRDSLESSAVQALRTQLTEFEAQYAQASRTYLDNYPPQVALRARIAEIRRQIGTTEGQYLRTVQSEYQAAAAKERELQQQVDMLTGRLTDMRGRSIQYNILQREVDTNRQLYDAILQRFKEIGVAGQIDSDFASPIDPAAPPGKPFSPDFLFNLLLALGAGIVLGGALVFLAFVMDDTIKSPEDVRHKLRLPCLGAIPTADGGVSFMEAVDDSKSSVAESYFSARAAIDFATASGTPRSIAITSASAGEGKSSSAFGLARSFAKNGKRVLLIDADMRRPTLVVEGRQSGDTRDTTRGLSVLLTGDAPLSEHISPTTVENIWAMPSGPIPPSPTELLSSKRMRDILSAAEDAFDLVIVDAPPVLGLADAPLLGGICQAMIFVIKSAGPRRKAILGALTRLAPSGTNLIGALLTQVAAHSGGYYYAGIYQYVYGDKVGSRDKSAGRQLPILRG